MVVARRSSMPKQAQARRQSGRRDAGFSLTEVVVGVVLMGITMATLSSAITVIMSQQDNASGRLNNATSAQRLSAWLPADMASADSFDKSPSASPCGMSCPAGTTVGGSNVILASWSAVSVVGGTPVTTSTNVSYRYMAAGSSWDIVRIKCSRVDGKAWTCAQRSVMSDVPPPPSGQTFVPGTTSPVWAMEVNPPMKADATSLADTVDNDPKNGMRVDVKINGGGQPGGAAGGGDMAFSVGAGSTKRELIEADSNVRIPTFTDAVSRCGGSFSAIVDSSGSIGSSMNLIKQNVKDLVDIFAGTPMKLQVVDFDSTARVLGKGYFDMLNTTDVADLKTAINTIALGGGTNWEDSLYVTFYKADGTFKERLPDKVLFFTDGQPSGDRLQARQPLAVAHPDDWWLSSSSQQRSFNRALRVIAPLRTGTTFIGVGVGPNIAPGLSSNLLKFTRGYRIVAGKRVYSEPFTAAESTNVRTTHRDILTQLITGDPKTGVEGKVVDGKYVNADVANMYFLPEFSQFAGALKAIALADCGGTLTVQTMEDGVNTAATFEYANTKLTSTTAVSLSTNKSLIVTDDQAPSGTLDFAIGGYPAVNVELMPTMTTTTQTLYKPVAQAGGSAWVCSAGGVNRAVTEVAIPGETVWKGISVTVASNEAVSCILNVAKV
jgi:Tfp pilus assembly protein PilV